MGYLDSILSFFKFTRDTDLVAAVCIVLLLSSLVGGLLSSIMKAFGGPAKPTPFTQTYGFKLLLAFEICVVAVVFYYHMRVTGKFLPIQIIFWVTTMLSIPVLWIIGSTTTLLIFWSKISKNKKAFKSKQAKLRAAKHKKLREKISDETKETREARKSREGRTAKGKKGHQAMVKRRREEG